MEGQLKPWQKKLVNDIDDICSFFYYLVYISLSTLKNRGVGAKYASTTLSFSCHFIVGKIESYNFLTF